MDDQRNAHDLRDDEMRVTPARFLAERVAVIRRQDDDALVVQAGALEKVDEVADTRVDPVHARRHRFEKSRVRLALGHSAAHGDRDVHVLRQRIEKHGPGSVIRQQRRFELAPRRAEIHLHRPLVFIEVDEVRIGGGGHEVVDDVIDVHRAKVAVRIEELQERVATAERLLVERVQHHAAGPDRRHG